MSDKFITGCTIDNKFVVSGSKIYELSHTHGYPLSLALHMLNDKINAVVDWDDYFRTALNDGMIMDNEYRRVCEAIQESYGDDYFKEWDKRAKILLLHILKESGYCK